jgi:hypothetical protein
MINADLHNHLRTSSRIRFRDFNRAVDVASSRLGKGGLVGIVNFSDSRYEDFVNCPGYEREPLGEDYNGVYVPEKDIYFVKGQEVPTKQGHLLILGIKYNVQLKDGRDIGDTIKEAKDNQGIIIADHPFYSNGVGDYLIKNKDVVGQLDGIEIHNGEACFYLLFGPFPRHANNKAKEFYQSSTVKKLGAISSSDGHSFYELGSSYTVLPDLDRSNFVESLRNSIRSTCIKNSLVKENNSFFGAMDHISDLVLIKLFRF